MSVDVVMVSHLNLKAVICNHRTVYKTCQSQ